MIPLSPDALARLGDLRDHLRQPIPRFVMDVWSKSDRLAPCGTAACIAGWLSLNADATDRTWKGTEDHACELLGLDAETAERLFIRVHWPPAFQARYQTLGDEYIGQNDPVLHRNAVAAARVANAAVAADLIDTILAAGGIGWTPPPTEPSADPPLTQDAIDTVVAALSRRTP